MKKEFNMTNPDPGSFELSPEQIKILEEELAAYEKNPDEGSTWEEVKKKILENK